MASKTTKLLRVPAEVYDTVTALARDRGVPTAAVVAELFEVEYRPPADAKGAGK